jgi:hypothetical protein
VDLAARTATGWRESASRYCMSWSERVGSNFLGYES